MIISHRYRFIFIKTFKTAGTSIEVFLSPLCSEADVVTPIIPPVEGHRPRNHDDPFEPGPELELLGADGWAASPYATRDRYFNHMPAWLVRCRVPARAWNDYLKFCVERNPWDKVVSMYFMVKHRSEPDLTLDEFIARRDFYKNLPLYTEPGGQGHVIVDHVLRYENLSDELAKVFSRLGIPFDGDLGVRAKGEYRLDHRSYRQILDDRQSRIIEQEFADEIALHGWRR